MSNEAERAAFEAWYNYSFRGCRALGYEDYALERFEAPPCQYVQEHPHARFRAFQAGAAYQRSIDKGLVEALEDAVDDYDAWKKDAEVTPNESLLNWVTKAKEALAIYGAAQEGE